MSVVDGRKMTTVRIILLYVLVSQVTGRNCPHEDSTLNKWSEPSSWPDNKVMFTLLVFEEHSCHFHCILKLRWRYTDN